MSTSHAYCRNLGAAMVQCGKENGRLAPMYNCDQISDLVEALKFEQVSEKIFHIHYMGCTC